MSASLSGLAIKYQCATSTVFRSTEQPCACMLTVLMERERTPCMFAITSEARQGSRCAGVEVAEAMRLIISGSCRDFGGRHYRQLRLSIGETAREALAPVEKRYEES